MTESGFYELITGTIGDINYIIKSTNIIPDENKDNIRNLNSRVEVELFLKNMLYSPNKAGDPDLIFQRSRTKSNNMINDYEKSEEIKSGSIMIGSKNSYDFIIEIENSETFVRWLDPDFILKIKKHYEEHNNIK